jgi:hypothetical protein
MLVQAPFDKTVGASLGDWQRPAIIEHVRVVSVSFPVIDGSCSGCKINRKENAGPVSAV